VKKELKAPLLQAMTLAITEFYGADPLQSPHLARIINDRHFQRLQHLLEHARDQGKILSGGQIDAYQRRIAPTLIDVDNHNDPLMAEELFGPLLPIISVANLDAALTEVRQQPKPLALYLFGGTHAEQQKLLETTSSGGVCFNDVVMQVGIPELPFGGVGASGMGSYHGKAGFETFSHQKSVLRRPFWLDLKMRYPPYKTNLALLKKLLG
ncbi:MAG: aldehyde dehydrogenase family protein, partial [Prochlorococcaceae cyanobacterium ETNP2_MAG_10]|nr:aldehyde dehydrogenase family protein [Prochlorococcaceae cyanobacterium ETNP2_MAG_10]